MSIPEIVVGDSISITKLYSKEVNKEGRVITILSDKIIVKLKDNGLCECVDRLDTDAYKLIEPLYDYKKLWELLKEDNTLDMNTKNKLKELEKQYLIV